MRHFCELRRKFSFRGVNVSDVLLPTKEEEKNVIDWTLEHLSPDERVEVKIDNFPQLDRFLSDWIGIN